MHFCNDPRNFKTFQKQIRKFFLYINERWSHRSHAVHSYFAYAYNMFKSVWDSRVCTFYNYPTFFPCFPYTFHNKRSSYHTKQMQCFVFLVLLGWPNHTHSLIVHVSRFSQKTFAFKELRYILCCNNSLRRALDRVVAS